jgi:hypothetical protein
MYRVSNVQSKLLVEPLPFGCLLLYTRQKIDSSPQTTKEIELDGQYGGRTQDLGVISTTL